MRFTENPLVTREDIKPSCDGYKVHCVLNPAAINYKDEIIMLLRVAEMPNEEPGYYNVPLLDLTKPGTPYSVKRIKKGDPSLDDRDIRVFKYEGKTYLSTISHLRVARSKDGHNFTIDPKPLLTPTGHEEEFGIEDARITFIDGVYYIYYVAVASYGFSTILAKTTDFKTATRVSNIFHGVNKDVAIFPEKINGKYYAFTRPDTGLYTAPSMWITSSPDLIHWGHHKFLFGPRKGTWDSSRIGSGIVPIKTLKGWLEIYHGGDDNLRYSLGIALLDLNDPSKVLYRDPKPCMTPDATYEQNGFVKNVIFTNGAAYSPKSKDELYMYYGAADYCVCGTAVNIPELIKNTI